MASMNSKISKSKRSSVTSVPDSISKTPPMKFWEDSADPEDVKALWAHPAVKQEWTNAGERLGQRVHMSRAFEGEAQVTETEMRAIADIMIRRHFPKLDPAMICAIAEIESNRHPLAYRWEEAVKEASTGLMQMLPSTAEWLTRDMGYRAYTINWAESMLYRPFVSVYFGAAYLKWLSTYEGKKRSEEFVVRGYNGGAKGAANKVTLDYWNKYLIAKQSLHIKSVVHAPDVTSMKPKPWPRVKAEGSSQTHPENSPLDPAHLKHKEWTFWEARTSVEDMESMWKHSELKKEWYKAGERRGKVRFSRDSKLRPFLTSLELKVVADNIISRFFSQRGVNSVMLCAIAEISSNRLLDGLDGQSGIMGLPFETASWLYTHMGYKSYRLKDINDFGKPFVSMYFGAAYVCWLANYGDRPRADEFVVRAYKGGLDDVDDASTGPFWLCYLEAKSHYRLPTNFKSGGCCVQ